MKKVILIGFFLFLLYGFGQIAKASYDDGAGLDYVPPNQNFGIHTMTVPEALTLNGNFALKDQAGAPSDTVGYGKLYNNNGDLYYQNGSSVFWINNGSIATLSETDVEAFIFDADAEDISGVWEVQDDIGFKFGTAAEWAIEYDDGVADQLLIATTKTAAISTSDPLIQVLVGTTPTANQQVFGVAKGTQASNTDLFTLDEDGDAVFTGDVTISGASTNFQTAIKAVDGAGSGVDADLLDGQSAPSGTIVGTSDTQTLTNKTISGASNTITNIGASGITADSLDFSEFDDNLWLDATTTIGFGSRALNFDLDTLVINGLLSRVGIGTSSPATNLHLSEDTGEALPAIEIEQLDTGGTGDAGIQFSVPATAYTLGIDNSDSDKFKISYASGAGNARIGTTDKLTIQTDGNVGIGTSSPGQKLTVAGTIESTSDGFKFPDGSTQVSSASAMTLRDNARGLIVTNNATNPTFQVDIDADEVILQNTSSDGVRASAVNLTVNLTTTGANGRDAGSETLSTWYHLWVIYNGTTVAGLISTSGTAPTMPSGYTYKAYAGAIYNDSSSDLITIYQSGRKVTRLPIAVLNGGIATTYTSFSLATGIPPNANAVYANAGLKQTSYLWSRQGGYFKSRSADDLGEISLIYYVEAVGGYTYTQGEITSSIMLPIIESQTLYYKCFNRSGNLVRGDANCDNDGPSPSDDGGGTAILFRVTGWELP